MILKGDFMNYSKKFTKKKVRSIQSNSGRYFTKLILTFCKTLLITLLLVCIMAACAGFGMVMGIIDNAPVVNIESIAPLGYATTVYDSQGNITDTLVMSGSNRQEASYEEFPQDLIDAFVAIEDSRFWQHNGIDTRSILRAIVGVITGNSSSGGGSTITQQLIKNNIFNGGREKGFGAKLERKLQEQYLAVQLEKVMDKKTILTNYLNTINLANNTLGVKVAARRYFDKEVSELTLSEATVIAGITQNPSRLNPISGAKANAEKRKVILQYMYDQGYITKEEQEAALADNVYERIQNVDLITKETTSIYSYFTDELVEQVIETFVEKLGYTETQAHNLLYSGGLSIYTTQDPAMQAIVDDEVNNLENYPVTQYSVEYRLSVSDTSGETKHYSENDLSIYHKQILGNASYDNIYTSEDAIYADIEDYKNWLLKDGGTVIAENIKTILEPQVSFVLMDQGSGEVKALSGGRGTKTASLTLNRASNVKRQPGSAFKVITAFAPALDTKGNTLGSVYYDTEYTVGNKTINNWYSSQGYLGWSSIRDGIIYSMNVVAVRTLMETVTPELGVEYAKNFGITSLTDTDFNASLALGGLTAGVSNLELTAAFATIGNSGVYTKPMFFTKILDHNGKVLIDNTATTHRVLKDSTAFLLTDAMAASMVSNRKFARSGVSVNATSTRAKLDSMSAAGKSGTTTSNRDIWFVGYTPYYTAGIWSGYDENQSITGGTGYHKDIWKKIMTRIHEGLTDPGFAVPSSIETAVICRKSGKLAIPGVCSADPRGNSTYTEYFAKGTVPTEMCDHHTSIEVCAESGGIPNAYCTDIIHKVITITPESSATTDDSYFGMPGVCTIHSGEILNTNPPQEDNFSSPPGSAGNSSSVIISPGGPSEPAAETIPSIFIP